MTESQEKASPLLRVFVYGTLKPGEVNYQKYCAGKVVDATPAIALGELFALPMGYQAMTLGNSPVHGYLLTFYDEEIFTQLDDLEDYQPERPESKNLYNRRQIEVYDQQGRSLGWAWAYLISNYSLAQLGGVVQSDGL
ncbi:gamma-glutamylcyclotransferase [Aetokthonos hydrillicola Thurmond2011]|jgi:gamma-glutamylcyclotransferase (GGCT)/AIG2-like uncharacterized protein YtfP|uniref:Gamma-glutamylcyclotransferase n=1 Tax=Aetokthonos hydrillicola Thurmond2011 TaxID=2712845 RepID=A0AAP5ME67_9CYAN|nr:gamma-glutamylcyclotransferase [Aetokthonos hydrillicola]MBO3464244.1 gamma-glutamylcyclotransferase [Aetokthonos hydrillicola CCALA 1050]MBW4590023.1 gamma-glutamylcyclotransferase [Aetokthonos hydrillicola CCALA 1050]MDR9900603.1 gamma-glutamylcyclotransferase [Aetokthonos hydrillicola Thurmond2011]